MSISVEIKRDAKGNIIVEMRGDLSYQLSSSLDNELRNLVKENPFTQINLDMSELDFVGSSGICYFVENIERLIEEHPYPKNIMMSNVSEDFKKIFRLYTQDESSAIWQAMGLESDTTSDMNIRIGARTRTFEN